MFARFKAWLKPHFRRWLNRRLELYDLAGLISKRMQQFDTELYRLEYRRASRFTIERRREEMRRHIRQMEEARDGFRDWPESEREAVAAIRAIYA